MPQQLGDHLLKYCRIVWQRRLPRPVSRWRVECCSFLFGETLFESGRVVCPFGRACCHAVCIFRVVALQERERAGTDRCSERVTHFPSECWAAITVTFSCRELSSEPERRRLIPDQTPGDVVGYARSEKRKINRVFGRLAASSAVRDRLGCAGAAPERVNDQARACPVAVRYRCYARRCRG